MRTRQPRTRKLAQLLGMDGHYPERPIIPEWIRRSGRTDKRILADMKRAQSLRRTFAQRTDPDDFFDWTPEQGHIVRATRRLFEVGLPKVMGEGVDGPDRTPRGIAHMLWATCHQFYSNFGRAKLVDDLNRWAKAIWGLSNNEARRQRTVIEIRVKLPGGTLTPRAEVADVLQELMRELAPNRCYRLRGTRRGGMLVNAVQGDESRLGLMIWPTDRRRDMSWLPDWITEKAIGWLRERGYEGRVEAFSEPTRGAWTRAFHPFLDGSPLKLDDDNMIDYILAERGDGRRGQPRWWSPQTVLSPRTRRRRVQRYRVYTRAQMARDMFERPKVALDMATLATYIGMNWAQPPASVIWMDAMGVYLDANIRCRYTPPKNPIAQDRWYRDVAYGRNELGKGIEFIAAVKGSGRSWRKEWQGYPEFSELL